MSPGVIVFRFMKFQLHLNTFLFFIYMTLTFISHVIHTYAIFIGEYAGEYGGGGGEYPQMHSSDLKLL